MLAYTVSYLCRTNLSVAMNEILDEFQISKSQAGLITTIYFWLYAGGQLAAGWMCTRKDPKYVLMLGLLLTALCNTLIGFVRSYELLLLLWSLNGLALALFWPPVIQIGTNWSEPEEYTRLSILLNLPTTVGFIIAWAGLGSLNTLLSWKWMFWLPAAVALGFLFLWGLLLHSSPEKAGLSYRPRVPGKLPNQESEPSSEKTSLAACLLTGTMAAYGLLVIFQGCTKESINLWAPTLLQEVAGGRNLVLVSAFTSLIPVVSTIGLFSTGALVTLCRGNQAKTMKILLGLGMAAGWAMVLCRNTFVPVVLFMGIVLAVVYGVNTVLTTMLPLQFAHTGRSGAISSVFNFLSYVGAALGGVISGAVADWIGWTGMYWLWAGLSTAALVLMLCIRRPRQKP